MKSITAQVRNFQTIRSNNECIAKNDKYGAPILAKLEEELKEIQMKISRHNTWMANRNSGFLIENDKIMNSKDYVEFTEKLDAICKKIGAKNKEQFVEHIRVTLNNKQAFFYYCTADPRKSTCIKPDKPQNFICVNVQTLQVEDRFQKIKNILA